jgi:chemotaxis protein methyltransferase CheR
MNAVADDILTDAEFTELAEMVYKHCGIDLHEGKRDLVRARLAKLTRVGGYRSAREYLDSVTADTTGEKFTGLIDALSTNLTSFFRENNHFEYLKRTLLPRLMAEKKSCGAQRLRVWSAGCSSGEEPYTLAMVLLEATNGGSANGWDVKLLATDISTRVLARAKRGVYDGDRLDSISPELRSKYVLPVQGSSDAEGQMSPLLQSIISFRHLNLMQPWPFKGPFDFIFCRNVMIYFDKPTQEALIARYHQVLAPGGTLFTGHSESLTGVRHAFKYVAPTIYAKTAEGN